MSSGIALYDHPIHGELVIVSEWGGGRVQVFRTTGEVFAIFGGVQHAHHAVVDGEGTIYVSEYATRRIKRFSLDGDSWGVLDESAVSLVAETEVGLAVTVTQTRVVGMRNRKRKHELE